MRSSYSSVPSICKIMRCDALILIDDDPDEGPGILGLRGNLESVRIVYIALCGKQNKTKQNCNTRNQAKIVKYNVLVLLDRLPSRGRDSLLVFLRLLRLLWKLIPDIVSGKLSCNKPQTRYNSNKFRFLAPMASSSRREDTPG